MRLVLVHSPLVGAGSWDPVAAHLRSHGAEVAQPRLTDLIADPRFWVRAAERVAGASGTVVLYSAAGLLAPLLGDLRMVFVDALLPRDGPTWWHTAPAAMRDRLTSLIDDDALPPFVEWWDPQVIETLLPDPVQRASFASGCPRIPMSLLRAPLPSAGGWSPRQAAYLRLSEGYDDDMANAVSRGWPTATLDGTHLSILTEPAEVAAAVMRLAGG